MCTISHPNCLGKPFASITSRTIDGVQLYKRILEFNPKLRAIMITAYAGDDGVQRALEAGTWKVLRKPVDIQLLLSMIKEAVA